jgi:hypothetical protein
LVDSNGRRYEFHFHNYAASQAGPTHEPQINEPPPRTKLQTEAEIFREAMTVLRFRNGQYERKELSPELAILLACSRILADVKTVEPDPPTTDETTPLLDPEHSPER